MLTGMLAVRNLRLRETNDLWNVNSEQEYHEQMETIEGVIRRAFMKLDRLALGLSTGTSAAILLFLSTLFLTVKSGPVIGPNMQLLNEFLPGYSVTFGGSLIGLGYGFLIGFVVGWSFAFMRNTAMFLMAAYLRRGAELRALRNVLEYI